MIYRILKKLLCLCETEESTIFYEIKELFQANIQQISEKDGLIILPALLNYVARQQTSREAEFTKEAFELYQLGIQSNLLIHNDAISETTFLNIVVVGTKLKQFDYIQSFIEAYEPMIKGRYREDLKILSFCFCILIKGNISRF